LKSGLSVSKYRRSFSEYGKTAAIEAPQAFGGFIVYQNDPATSKSILNPYYFTICFTGLRRISKSEKKDLPFHA
jgi:hypothetical protein